jgi:hypothetical protein
LRRRERTLRINGRLIEDLNLRNKIRVFRDRAEAGRLLSEKIKHLASPDIFVPLLFLSSQ